MTSTQVDEAPSEVRTDDEGSPEKHHRPLWRELPVLVVIAFAAALLLKSLVVQAFYIPSESMVPTLQVGDRVLVEKVALRFRDPRPGEVVVFTRDFDGTPDPQTSVWDDISSGFRGLFGFPTGDDQDFIKRVVAVAGDTIEGRDGQVLVNGDVVDEPYLPAGVTTEPFPPYTVPKDEIFVMGDNRGNSDDSRSFGAVPEDEVVGRAFVLIWPPSDMKGL
ncbi:MAG TPA: signal peptidase I [Actinomycetota bacterium]|nr:signal peptidase I [Actinomycetota bacterium]